MNETVETAMLGDTFSIYIFHKLFICKTLSDSLDVKTTFDIYFGHTNCSDYPVKVTGA